MQLAADAGIQQDEANLEIARLLNDAAVVAREYRIPAVVNLHNATVTFRTGDLVELDANQGVLRRISEG
ncbi:MAG: PEP-utilizing enzyme [Halobacteriota archaeon]